MDKEYWEQALAGIELGPRYYYDQVGSTNDVAASLVREGAGDLAVVLADEQTAGRGRRGRTWHTPPGAALAVSVILSPQAGIIRAENLSRVTGLGALAVAGGLRKSFSLPAGVKWPNDVLLDGKKVCGVLVEADWKGDQLGAVILGMGINVRPDAVPDEEELGFPATSLEAASGRSVARNAVLAAVLRELVAWYPRLDSPSFLDNWEEKLVYRDQQVLLYEGDAVLSRGQVVGLDEAGALQLRDEQGKVQSFQVGEIQLRPVDRT